MENLARRSFKRFFSMPRIIKRFRNDEKGITAVEFAFVGPPFFLIIFSIIEVSIYLFATQYLETSIDNVARDIRTGTFQTAIEEIQAEQAADPDVVADTYKELFKEQFCQEIVVLFDCNRLLIQVTTAQEFSNLNGLLNGIPDQDNDGNFDPNDFDTANVAGGEIFKVQAVYEWPVYTNYASRSFTGARGTTSLYINATAVVRAEQF